MNGRKYLISLTVGAAALFGSRAFGAVSRSSTSPPSRAITVVPELSLNAGRFSVPIVPVSIAPAWSLRSAARTVEGVAATEVPKPEGSNHAVAIQAVGLPLGPSTLFDGAGARNALEKAADDDYTVDVYRSLDSGRLAVILGESHIKAARAQRLGNAVLDKFSHYALEGFDTESTWSRRFNFKREMKDRERLSELEPENYGRGSTVHDAYDRASARPFDLAPRPRISLLENGHRPDLLEKIAVWDSVFIRFPIYFLMGAGVAAFIGTVPGLKSAFHVAGGLVALALAGWTYMIAGGILLDIRPVSSYGVLFPFDFGLMRARDKTMSANLSRYVSEEAGRAPILAVVGKRHSVGMGVNLTRFHGFEKVELHVLETIASPP